MDRSSWFRIAPLVFAAAGCVENENSLVFIQNQFVTRMNNCAVTPALGIGLSGGLLDVGLVEAGAPGYTMAPILRNNFADRTMVTGTNIDNIIITGTDIEVQPPPALAAMLPRGQRNYFVPALGGGIAVNTTVGFLVEALPRQVALQLASGVTGTEPDPPRVNLRFRVVGQWNGSTLSTPWLNFPIKLCQFCLSNVFPCPAGGLSAESIALGGCNPAQDEPVTCCEANGNLFCGPAVPKKAT